MKMERFNKLRKLKLKVNDNGDIIQNNTNNLKQFSTLERHNNSEMINRSVNCNL